MNETQVVESEAENDFFPDFEEAPSSTEALAESDAEVQGQQTEQLAASQDSQQEAPAEELPFDEIDGLTEAAEAAKGGFVITDREGIDWYLEKVMMNEVEIKALKHKAELLIEAIKTNTERQVSQYAGEIRSLEWRFGQQVEQTARRLIAQQKRGKTIAFTYGSIQLRSHKAAIEVVDDDGAITYLEEKELESCLRKKPALAMTAFKEWAMEQLEAIHIEVLQCEGGDLDKADFARAMMLELEYPFLKLVPAGDKLITKVGA